MAKKKDKAKAPKGKRIKVAKVKKKKPRASKKRKRAPKARKGKGQYSNFFPTNRQIDSNQYWQLRAEIAGAESLALGNAAIFEHALDGLHGLLEERVVERLELCARDGGDVVLALRHVLHLVRRQGEQAEALIS